MTQKDTLAELGLDDPKPKRGRPRKATPKTTSNLDIDLDTFGTVKELESRFFWVGAFPICPVDNVHLGGVCFPKITERLVKVPTSSKKQRSPQAGTVTRFTAEQAEIIIDRLKRSVVRFHEAVPDWTTPEGLEDMTENRYKGEIIRVPAPAEVAELRKQGRPVTVYRRGPHDYMLATMLFAVQCPDQERPSAGTVYPEPLSVTGLTW